MLQQPGRDGMCGREVLPNPGLEAELQRPVEAPDDPDANLDASIRLRVVCNRVLLLNVDEALVHLKHPGYALAQCLERGLVV